MKLEFYSLAENDKNIESHVEIYGLFILHKRDIRLDGNRGWVISGTPSQIYYFIDAVFMKPDTQ